MKKEDKYLHKKSQGLMIVLALFLGFWSWIYTMKYDSWKFWICLVLNILLFWTIFVPLLTWLWAFIDSLAKPKALFTDYYK